MSKQRITPVILSGGSGSRLWPLSRTLYPKQLLPLVSTRTMIQETALRLGKPLFSDPLVICNESHRFIVAEQLREVGINPSRIVLETAGRNTAPACAVAAILAMAADPEAIIAVLPSDHAIGAPEAFRQAMEKAADAARAGFLVTFGIRPTGPETGYGYILQGEPLNDGCFRVAGFIEKPDRPKAEAMLSQPGYSWNSGMFVFRAQTFLEELRRLEPEIAGGAAEAVRTGLSDMDFLRLGAKAFAATPAVSIDYAVMEKTDKAAVVPGDFSWNDVGSWSSLLDISPKDGDGNASIGDVLSLDCQNSYLRGEDIMVAAIGLSDVVVVATADAVLVADKSHVQDVRKIVDRLKAQNRNEGDLHRRVFRPWGFYQSIDSGSRFQVKQIMIRPGGILSLQMHHHRAEHWIVVEGTAKITCNDKTFLLAENESTYIPLGSTHRLENPGKVPLRLIEVQSGSYLGEDDIVRFEDIYGRTT